MELSVTLDYLEHGRASATGRDLQTAARISREGGIRYADYVTDFSRPDWEKRAHEEREILDREGIKVEQSHAPMNRYGQWNDNDNFMEMFRRSFVCAKILGAKYMVVHADESTPLEHWDVKKIIEHKYGYIAPMAEYCRANGMCIAIENLFEDGMMGPGSADGRSRFTSTVEEQIGIIERFADPAVGACWDFGHAACANGYDGMTDALRAVGKYLMCTHVHDNNYRQDQHLIPFMGEIRWADQMRCLKEIGYRGKLSLELVYGHIPDELMPAWMGFLVGAGNKLNEMYEAF